MFDIGFSELLVVFVVGLLILGPDRLPHAAKTAGLWIRKIRRSINSVQREINAQLDQEELQQKISETNQRLLKEDQVIQNTITPFPEDYRQEKKQPEPLKPGTAEEVNIATMDQNPNTDNLQPIAPETNKHTDTEAPSLNDVEKAPKATSRP
ncbi:Sec-independent protein translocase protein TatB [Marinomonas profundimaris]|uniref:Sec-independent protein translocase protein TatB n=1 Tax=Marinomonas profundimaris TaxID=1208321 RepID=W1RXX7_9GAMM|nr:Sec-independent protein translocase protein TatB [Marinomonas profundimaris]ETI60564.1 preprotein translocase subunit TatA [Marinomonas profundimaris]